MKGMEVKNRKAIINIIHLWNGTKRDMLALSTYPLVESIVNGKTDKEAIVNLALSIVKNDEESMRVLPRLLASDVEKEVFVPIIIFTPKKISNRINSIDSVDMKELLGGCIEEDGKELFELVYDNSITTWSRSQRNCFVPIVEEVDKGVKVVEQYSMLVQTVVMSICTCAFNTMAMSYMEGYEDILCVNKIIADWEREAGGQSVLLLNGLHFKSTLEMFIPIINSSVEETARAFANQEAGLQKARATVTTFIGSIASDIKEKKIESYITSFFNSNSLDEETTNALTYTLYTITP